MTIPELLQSLTYAGLSLARGPDDSLAVKGDIGKLSIEHRRALKEHKGPLLELLTTPTCLTLEQREREAIRFADTPEAKGLASEYDIFDEAIGQHAGQYTPQTELWNWIGAKESLRELNALERFIQELSTSDYLKTEAAELIANRRALLIERERHNQKASEPGADTPNSL